MTADTKAVEAVALAVRQALDAAGLVDPEWVDAPKAAQAVLSALSAAGYAVVPREPTPEMMQAALTELSDATVEDPKAAAWDALRAYRAMLGAAKAKEGE